ncbi:Uncharacterized protein dnm_076190 [Desulfonema magnum]|uniref:Uncharacterized protein n=1 Tax=Desulfonema magnum TaxID=45655 RepID=A0A975BTM6_9BACT|nr:Uncharacterized protein dnm_076190 [Desulfonema magnum]
MQFGKSLSFRSAKPAVWQIFVVPECQTCSLANFCRSGVPNLQFGTPDNFLSGFLLKRISDQIGFEG